MGHIQFFLFERLSVAKRHPNILGGCYSIRGKCLYGEAMACANSRLPIGGVPALIQEP